ncbi:unnamed protein product, partial [Pocillopora meandrina]
ETDLNNNFEIREKMEFERRRRVSAPAKPYGGSEKLENKLKHGFYGGGKKLSQSALLISPSWQSFDREDVGGDPLDTSWDYIEEMMKDNKKAETIKLLKTQQVRGSVKALSPRTTAETTTTLKQLKKEISRKFSRARSDSKYSLIPWMDCSDWEESSGDFIPVEFNLGFLDDYMPEKGSERMRKNGGSFEVLMKEAFSEISENLKEIEEEGVKQKQKVDIQRRRRISAPVTSFGRLDASEKDVELIFPKRKNTQPSLVIAWPELQSVEEESEEGEDNEVLKEEIIAEIYKKEQNLNENLPRRRRVSAPAKTFTETADMSTFKQLRKDIGRRLSRTRSDPIFSTLPWLDWIDEEPEPDFEPVEFNLDFLEELIKG